MKALVVHSYPNPEGFGADLCAVAVRGLRSVGHEVEVVNLHSQNFTAAMSAKEHRAYHGDQPVVDPMVAQQAELLANVEILIFIYPTWLFGMPAIMKGWFDRVLVPSVAFELHPSTGKIEPQLRHVRHLISITTSKSAWWQNWAFGNAGRWCVGRTLRFLVHPRARHTWLCLDRIDKGNENRCRAFLEKVERKVTSRK